VEVMEMAMEIGALILRVPSCCRLALVAAVDGVEGWEAQPTIMAVLALALIRDRARIHAKRSNHCNSNCRRTRNQRRENQEQ